MKLTQRRRQSQVLMYRPYRIGKISNARSSKKAGARNRYPSANSRRRRASRADMRRPPVPAGRSSTNIVCDRYDSTKWRRNQGWGRLGGGEPEIKRAVQEVGRDVREITRGVIS